MRFVTVHQVDLLDLIAMANGDMEDTVSDMDFLETLGRHRCILVPPFVMRTSPSGRLSRVCKISYNIDGDLDKAAILVAAARHLHTVPTRNPPERFGGRFANE